MIITTVLQLLVDRIDLGLTLPQAIADPRASQRNTTATAAEPAFRASPEAALPRAGTRSPPAPRSARRPGSSSSPAAA